MLLPLLLILAITAGGFALTYLFEDEEPFLWRLSAGSVIGSAVFGTTGFVLAMFLGLSSVSIFASLAITLAPLIWLIRGGRRKTFEHDWAKAKGKLQGATSRKALRFCYYAAFLLLFIFFFDRAMIETDQGIFTGGSQNLGDLPFHLGVIFGFTDGANFPPQNPSFAGAKFSYPFIADFLTACFVKLGIGVREAMLVQNVAWAFSLLVILERYVLRLVGDRLAARLAPALLFFSGGLGFIWFFGDYWAQTKGFFDFLGSLPKDYTISDHFRWGNSMVTLFITQRSLLLGMPITLIVLGTLWRIFTTGTQSHGGESHFKSEPIPAKGTALHSELFITFTIGLLAGLLPLVHLHSLFVLFVVAAFLFFLKQAKWREWMAFGAGVCVVAIPELIWSISGSATRASAFFEFHFGGLDSTDPDFLWFWVRNTGILIPLIVAGLYLVYFPQSREGAKEEARKKEKGWRKNEAASPFLLQSPSLLLFYIPFAFLFVISNIAKLAPWEWDNIKVLIYWFVGSIPFVAFAIAWMWRKTTPLKFVAAICFTILIFSGALDVWRTASRQVNNKVFDADAVTVANRIKASTAPSSLFLNAPTYNTAIVLSGRRSLMRYPGHLASHGIDFRQREEDVKQMYGGGSAALSLIEKYGIEYVLISPEERNTLKPNEEFFKRFPVIAESGQYKVYKVK